MLPDRAQHILQSLDIQHDTPIIFRQKFIDSLLTALISYVRCRVSTNNFFMTDTNKDNQIHLSHSWEATELSIISLSHHLSYFFRAMAGLFCKYNNRSHFFTDMYSYYFIKMARSIIMTMSPIHDRK